MYPLYCFIYVTGDKVTWASARTTRHISEAQKRKRFSRARCGTEQLFTTVMFDTPKEAEHAIKRLSQILRAKFRLDAPSKQRSVVGVTKLRAIILPAANEDLCFPNREAEL